MIKEFIIHSMTQGATGSVPVHIGTATLVARDEDLNTGTIPMPTFARKFIISGGYSPQRQQISDLQFDKFPTRSAFLCWKIRFKNQVTTCSDFPSEAMLWIKEVEMVDSLDELTSSRSVAGKNFQNFEDEEEEAQKEDPVSTGETDRLHDLRLFSSHWCS